MDIPEDINVRAQRLWNSVVQDYDLADHQYHILRRVVETITQVDIAREQLKLNGTIYYDRFEQPHERPEVAIVRNGVALERTLLRELYLDPPDEDTDS